MTTNTRTATHNGTCQGCGRKQALTPSGMAKHGYTVKWGFFMGTCGGSNRQPLEFSRDYCDQTQAALLAHAEKLEAGAKPEAITHVTVTVYTKAGYQTTSKQTPMTREEYAAHTGGLYFQHGTWEKRVQREVAQMMYRASSCREAAAALKELAGKVYGQPLEARHQEPELQRKRFKWEDRAAAYELQSELKAKGIKATVRRESKYSTSRVVTWRA